MQRIYKNPVATIIKMGNEESLAAGGGASGGTGGYSYPPGQGPPGAPGGIGHPGQNISNGPSLGNFSLGNLSNLGNNLSNTMSNLSATSGGLLRPPGSNSTSSFNNLANLGSNITSNLSNLGGNLTSNLSNIGGNLTGNLASNLGANLNPNQSGTSSEHKSSSQAPKPKTPEIDLSGLTEEEQAMIQSVMIRAQEAESGSSNPSLHPPAGLKSSQISHSNEPLMQSQKIVNGQSAQMQNAPNQQRINQLTLESSELMGSPLQNQKK